MATIDVEETAPSDLLVLEGRLADFDNSYKKTYRGALQALRENDKLRTADIEHEAEIAALKADKGALAMAHHDLEVRVSELEADKGALEVRVSELEAEIVTLTA